MQRHLFFITAKLFINIYVQLHYKMLKYKQLARAALFGIGWQKNMLLFFRYKDIYMQNVTIPLKEH